MNDTEHTCSEMSPVVSFARQEVARWSEEMAYVSMQTIGRRFGVSAIAVGRKLKEIGWRTPNGDPVKEALHSGMARSLGLPDGKPFYRWHYERTVRELEKAGWRKRI